MLMLQKGLYEKLISTGLRQDMEKAEQDGNRCDTAPLTPAEAPEVISAYVADILTASLRQLRDRGEDLSALTDVANRLIGTLQSVTDSEGKAIEVPSRQLLAVYEPLNTVYALDDSSRMTRPSSSLARSRLFTNDRDEPPMYLELKKEILSSDKIDMLVSFIRWSGLRFILDELEHFTKTISACKQKGEWNRGELIDLFNYMIPNFNHKETGKFLDGRM